MRQYDRETRLDKLYRQSMMLYGEPLNIVVQATRILSETYRVKAVYVAKIHNGELYFLVVCLQNEVRLNVGSCALNNTLCTAVAASKEICVYDEAAMQFPESGLLLQQHPVSSYCAIPSPDKSGNIVGVIGLLDDKAQTFSPGDFEFLQHLGQRIGLEIERLAQQEQRNHALAATEARERHYRLILNGARNGIMSIDATGRIDTFNPAAGAILGYRPTEVIDMDAATLLESCGIDLNALTTMARQNGSAIGCEATIRKKDGSTLSAELSVTSTPLLDQWMHVVIIRDISDRKLKEKQLAEAQETLDNFRETLSFMESRMRHLLLNTPSVIYQLFFINGVFMPAWVSPSIADFGYSAEEPYNLDWWQNHVHPHDRERILAASDWYLTTERFTTEYRLLLPDGRHRWVQDRRRLIRGEHGAPQEIIGSWTDISERKEAEISLQRLNTQLEERIRERTLNLEQLILQLRSKEEEIRSILESAVDCIICIDADGTIRSANPATEKVFGYRPEALIGKNVSILMPEPDRSTHDIYLENYRRSGRSQIIGTVREVEGLTKEGRRIPLELAVNEYYVHGKQFFTGIIRDITETKQVLTELQRARDEAEQANRAKSVFLAAMSHEIRTPMNGVIGMIEVLKQTPLTFTQTDMIKTIHDSAFMLLRVIDDILDFSKIEAGKLEIAPEAVSIGNLLQSICDTMSPLAARQTVQLRISIDPALPASICADPVRLRQIFYNLISNAVKFSGGRPDHPGEVTVHAEHCELNGAEQLCIRISDNGIGMAPETLDRLFSPFVQADSATTRRYGGSGLGLSICKRLVELMNGYITVDSELGCGSTFTVTLPLETVPSLQPSSSGSERLNSTLAAISADIDEDSAEVIFATPNIEEARSQGRLILIAEDNDINRKVMVHQLASIGYAAETAKNGQEALQLWRKNAYALLFSDLHMPDMDGYELAAAIRQEENGKHMPIIAFTANAIKGENAQCFEVGMDDYLTKPVNMRLLKAILAKWLPLSDTNTPHIQNSAPLVDIEILKALIGYDPAILNEFLHDYAVAAGQALTEIQQAFKERDAGQISAVAHRFKSASLSVGAMALGDTCEMLEGTRQSADWNEIETHICRFTRLEAEVQSYIKRLMENSQ